MKTSHLSAVSAVAIIVSSLAATHSLAATSTPTIPAAPAGSMSAFPTQVQTGTKPTLTWSIMFPSYIGSGFDGGGGSSSSSSSNSIIDSNESSDSNTTTTTKSNNGNGNGSGGGDNGSEPLVLVNPPGSLIPSQSVYVAVQMIGTKVTTCDAAQDGQTLYSEARISVAGGAYSQLFYGTQADVDPSKQLYIKKISANQSIDFGGRYVKNGAWSPFYTTNSGNMQVVALVNGDTPPTNLPLYQSSILASYLKPYLDATGKVKIGALSVLIMMELGQANRASTCFDLQDQVLLVTFSANHPNNGHGNNLDGVDSSNPGNGQGGPNGAVDLSAGVDDEIK